jgi:nicotinate-nucleotide pyrophosphorylase (carboxylating)
VNPDFIKPELFFSEVNAIIDKALFEDIREGDHTSLATIPDNKNAKARLLVKDEGIIAGIDLAELVFNKVDSRLILEKIKNDGDCVHYEDVAFFVEGPARSILTAERLVLNFIQRLSGIATKTHSYIQLIKDFPVKLLDTRKTTPGLRLLEKWAVKIGGGYNHRIGLYDMILIKDNHVDYSGGIREAVYRVKKYLAENNLDLKIEVEVRNLQELDDLLTISKIDRVLLDNFTPAQIKEAVKIINGRIETEASGKITETNIVDYAKTGVDFISSGSLTTSIRSLDLSLKLII